LKNLKGATDMEIIAHVLAWMQHAWKWLLAGAGGLAIAIRVFWEPIMKAWKSFYEALEARHKARKAKADARISEATLPDIEWEARVQDMVRRFQRRYNETEAKFPGKHYTPNILPSPEDDIEVFNEAMRRIKKQNVG
jgi:hypothetical protein